jgi:glycosyltransferase involved in cell wall biosynthesis
MKFAFVLPRFGESIIGGVESLAGSLARALQARGDQVEVWTTCASDNRTWENDYIAGESLEFGVVTRRFPVSPRNLESWIPLQLRLHEGFSLTIDEELEHKSESVISHRLFEHIASHARHFDLIFYAPYLFGTSFWGALIHPQNAALIPCLHDEPDAYTQVMRSLFSGVRGALFNAEPEMQLARELFGPIAGGVVGVGFEAKDYRSEEPPYFEGSDPYIVYVGRKETGKNAHLLLDYFMSAKESGTLPSNLKLVVMGGGSFSDLLRPEALERSDIIDLPALSESDKRRVIQHALALTQPSLNESFSIVLMEAWLLGTPVLVHGQGAVTKHHVIQSGGGLYFSSAEDLLGVLRYLLESPALAKGFGDRGKAYVEREYSWKAVLARFDNAIMSILEDR